MATAGTVNRTSLGNLLKYVYYPKIVAQYYNEFPLHRRIEARCDESDFSGKQAVIPVSTGWAETIGSRAEGGTLPGAYYEGTENMLVDVAYNYGTLAISRPSMRASRNNAGAWEKFLRRTMQSVKENISWDRARQAVHGDGTGILCLAGTGATSATLPVTPIAGDHFLRKNMVIDVYTAGGSQEINSIRITNVDGNTITLESSQTWTTNSYVYREDNRNAEMMGLGGIMDDGGRVATFQNLLRSSNTWLKANIMGNSGTNRALTLPLIDQAFLRGQTNGGGGTPSLIASNHLQALKYLDILRADRRYSGEEMTLDGGFKALKYTGPGGSAPWLMDRMVRRYEIWFIVEDDIKQYVMDPLTWVDDDGNVLQRTANKDQFEAYMAEYAQICAERTNRCTVLDDILES